MSTTNKHLVLHATAIKENHCAEEIAGLVGTDPDETAALLERAVESGRAVKAKGNYVLTPAGRMIVDNQYTLFYGELRADEAFLDLHERFEELNLVLKQCITDWQTRNVEGEQVANDHTDSDYDNEVLDRLDHVQEQIEGILDAMAARLPRLSLYKSKLEAALEKAEGGDPGWISDAKIDSYHTVWFELHEDILRILGRARHE